MAWNLLPDSLRDPSHCSSIFRRNLKAVLFARYYSVPSALDMLHDNALYKFNIDIELKTNTP